MKYFIQLITILICCFGFWWLIFWFLTSEINPYLWHWLPKFCYLFFGITSTRTVLDEQY